jgi:hypothetical protein
MIKKITFIPSSLDTEKFVDFPRVSKKFIPQWYKDIKSEYLKNPKFEESGRLENVSLKQCMPFLDAMSSGYIQPTWCDIYVSFKNDEVSFKYAAGPKIMNVRKELNLNIAYDEYHPFEFTWCIEWIMKAPKGYSLLITHPMNRIDLPFYTLSGIIDSDHYHHGRSGNLPFYIKKGFEGLIPTGTPMFQIIPIKRNKWISVKNKFSVEVEKKSQLERRNFWEFYKKNMWQKKQYEDFGGE